MSSGAQNARVHRPASRGVFTVAPPEPTFADDSLEPDANDERSSGAVLIVMALCALSGLAAGFVLGLGTGLAF